MTVEEIGTFAGEVWKALAEQNANSIKTIKKATKLKEKENYAALGWLSREGKLHLGDAGDPKEVDVVLIEK